jgi:hypothetical protein
LDGQGADGQSTGFRGMQAPAEHGANRALSAHHASRWRPPPQPTVLAHPSRPSPTRAAGERWYPYPFLV